MADKITLDSLGKLAALAGGPLGLAQRYGPDIYDALNEGARQAFEQAGSLQRGGSYDAGPVTLQALGAVGAPVVGPAQGLATLGAGMVRRAAPAVRTTPAQMFDYSRLREVPDVPQFNLPRYEPPRGVPERTQALADPANVARVNEVVKRGAQQGGMEWYNTDPLRQAFVGELGAEKGTAAYQQYLDMVSATSPRATVPVNARNASYYYTQAQQGQPVPSVPLPQPYGHIAQKLHIQNARNILEQGGIPPLQNPKPASFAQNLAGNQTPVTIDTHNIRLLGSELDKPAKTEYGFLERLQQEEAAKMGMTPAQYQASAWIGGGEQTGLKSSADPFLKVFEDRVRLTADKTGIAPEEVLRRMIRGEQPLLSTGAVPIPTNRQD